MDVHHTSHLMKCYRVAWNLLLDQSGGSDVIWSDRVIVRVGDGVRTAPVAEFTPDHQLVITEDCNPLYFPVRCSDSSSSVVSCSARHRGHWAHTGLAVHWMVDSMGHRRGR